jgi:hypothetical protein
VNARLDQFAYVVKIRELFVELAPGCGTVQR